MSSSSFVPLRNHSTYSLYRGLSKPIQIAERAGQLGLSALAITDFDSLAATVQIVKNLQSICVCGFHKDNHEGHKKSCVCTKFEKRPIKPILGCDFRISHDDSHSYITILAKNLQGWKSLLALVSEANKEENIYKDSPLLDHLRLPEFTNGNLIGISGYAGSQIAKTLIPDETLTYMSDTYQMARSGVSAQSLKNSIKVAETYRDFFGAANFFLSVDRMDKDEFPASEVIANAIRHIGEKTGITCVAGISSHYPSKESADDQRILLCSDLGTNYNDISKKMERENRFEIAPFLRSEQYHIPSYEEVASVNTEQEISCSLLISDMCEVYDVLGKPLIPEIKGPNGESPPEFLKALCGKGWNKKIKGKIEESQLPIYKDRIRMELEVMRRAGLSSYFLVVEEYVGWAHSQGIITAAARGSSGGSMIAHLLDITDIDPVAEDLWFERFYNEGRNTADRISLPDIDTDFPKYRRDEVIAHCGAVYGWNKVAQICTYSRMQGRGALSEVFRAKYPSVSFADVKKITSNVPDESEINDELQAMREAGVEPSIIGWALENNKKKLQEYCYVDEEGELQGQYKVVFEQAMRIEGSKKDISGHASGYIISPLPLATFCPMIYSNYTKKQMVGLEMNDAEAVGASKYDLLSTTFLDKVLAAKSIIENGRII
jgi:DNA polymerase-3 subunit alpha